MTEDQKKKMEDLHKQVLELKDELSEEDLEGVAGGASCICVGYGTGGATCECIISGIGYEGDSRICMCALGGSGSY